MDINLDYSQIFNDVIAALISGILLTFLFFFIKEKLFPIPNITGKWTLEIKIKKTNYKPYKDMILKYSIIIYNIEKNIKGSAEKIYEKSTKEEKEYIGKKRTRAKIEGYIEKKYFGKDKIYLHIIEKGEERESTTFYELIYNSHIKLSGTFTSTIADQSGTAICKKETY